MPTASPSVQVFGLEGDSSTRAALRFFKERRIAIHFVDLHKRPLAAGELRRFVERFGAASVAYREGRAWRDGGLAYLRMEDGELADRLLADQRLLRLPLVRAGNALAVGRDDAGWKAVAAVVAPPPLRRGPGAR